MHLWQEIALGSFLVLSTTLVHTAATLLAMNALKKMSRASSTLLSGALLISGLVVVMFLVSLLEAGLWGYAYLTIGAIENLEETMYFSMVTFTTLGYGDITLGPGWRLLASFEAANGTIMFGWTTALVVAYMQRLAPKRSDRHRVSKKEEQ